MTLKPDQDLVEKGGWRGFCFGKVQKLLLVTTHSQIALFSKKINMKWLRLQFVAGYNWSKNKASLDYRITTKWSDGARIKRKERVELVPDRLLASAKWNMDFALPDIEGHLGSNGHNDPVDVQFGRLDFSIDQLDLTLMSPFFAKIKSVETLPSAERERSIPAEPTEPNRTSRIFGWLPWKKGPH